MIRWGMVLGIAQAERRLTRRLVRYWIFMAISWLIAALLFTQWTFVHWQFSSWSATAASINPRYLIGGMGVWYLLFYCLGLVFLAFDVRARDTRERMVDVLDSRPCSNVELLLGKLLGLLIPSWIPVIAIAIVLTLVGSLLTKSPMEPWSVLGFCTAMVLPAFTFTIALVYLVTLLVRNRLIAAVLSFAAIAGIFAGIMRVPIYLMPVVDLTGGYIVNFPSDIHTGIADLGGWLQRVAVTLAGLGLLWIAAAIHPRKDGVAPAGRLLTGAGLLVVAATICYGHALQSIRGIADQRAWKAAHEALRDAPAPDVLAMSGSVIIEPGRRLSESLTLLITAPDGQELDEALFSLNPGLQVTSLTSNGNALRYTHENGLLRVSLGSPLSPGRTLELQLEAAGLPSPWFAYLDGAIDPLQVSPWDGQIFLLGFIPIHFDKRFVALMPGARWLPAGGSEIGRADPRHRAEDLFDLDLTVELPEGWTAAGPARRVPVDAPSGAAGRAAFRFQTTAPVPEAALIAGRFESRSTEIRGVNLELLVHPGHAANADFFADATGEIRGWLEQRMTAAAEIGLDYPYDALTLVEVPNSLRGFAGGWRMDTALVQPAMILMREMSFPTARFDTPFKDDSAYKDKEGGIPKGKLDVLLRFFENDFNGGNPFIGAARSYFGYVTSAFGDEGLPLDFICEDLSTRLVTDKRGYFSAHLFDSDINAIIGESIFYIVSGRGAGRSVTESIIDSMTSKSDVWNAVLDVSLERLDPWDDPKRAINVLTLKGGAMASSMLDELGAEATGKLLAAVRRSDHSGRLSRESLLAAGIGTGVDLEPWLDLWIAQTALPGFKVPRAELFRLKDGEDGSPRYQLLVTVQNDEPIPGLVRLEYRVGRRGERGERGGGRGVRVQVGPGDGPDGGGDVEPPEHTTPVRVDGRSAVQIGVVVSEPPRAVRVSPYFSLNRTAFAVELPQLDEERIVDRAQFSGSQLVEHVASDEGIVVVDDLDPGFAVEGLPERSFLRFGGKQQDEELDGGLPVAAPGPPPRNWSRRTSSDAYGRYRHTMAFVRKGKGTQHAVFTAEIQRAGRFRLETHVPPRMSGDESRERLGSWNYDVAFGGESKPVKFEAKNAEQGWNALGEFELGVEEVRVSISDQTDGRLVVADAIRWVPVETSQVAGRLP